MYDFKSAIRTLGWAFRLTWAAHARLTAGVIITAILRNLLPAALVLVAKSLVNSVSDALSSGTGVIESVVPILAIGLVVSVLEALSRNLCHYHTERLRDELDITVSSRILEHGAKLDLAFFEDPGFQDLLDRARQNTAGHFSQFITCIIDALANTVQIISFTLILVFIEPYITMIFLLLGLPFMLAQWRIAQLRYETEHARATRRRWTGYYVSRILQRAAVPETRLLGLAPLFIGKFRDLMQGFRDQNRYIFLRGLGTRSLFSIISNVGFYAACAWVVYRTVEGDLTIGDVVIFAAVAVRLPRVVEVVVLAMTKALENGMFISNMMQFLRIQPKLVDGPRTDPPDLGGEISVRNVSFTYPGSPAPALDDVSLTIKPGECLALVGENGAGKSTLVKLITRFYDPDRGDITIGGTDIRDFPLQQLHAGISFVFQNFGRYEATAAENIAFGNWRELLEDEQRMEAVARLAGVDQIVSNLPQGYGTHLGRMFGDYNLSEGQWQKIAIARALARKASLLILDEPTSSLDARSEYELFLRFREISREQTGILISHRFSTVSIADRIAVMDQGRIIELGTHRELMERSGHYAALYDLHQRKLESPRSDAAP